MDSLYSISVRLGLDATGFSGATALATTVLQKLEKQAIATSGSTAGLGKSLEMVAGGMALIVGGMAGVHVLASWATAAGKMQDALTQVGIAAGGTQAQLHALFNQSFGVANQTQYQGADVLSMDQIMARMGFRDLSGKQTQRQVIHDAVPDFARAAEIIQHFTGDGYQATVTALAQQAHMFGAYSGQALKQNVAWATGAALVSHMDPTQEVNVLRYMAPAVKSGQITSLDALSLAALGNQTGLTVGGRAASSIGTLLRELSPNGSAKHDDALAHIERLGGGNFYQHGALIQPPAWLGILNKFYDATKHDQPLQTYLAKYGLLVQGQQAASVLASDTSIKQYGAIHAQLVTDTPGWARTTQGQLNATLPGQLQTLTGNLGSIQALLGTQLLPALAPVIHGFVELTGGIVTLLTLHPEVAQFIVTFTAVATAAALIAGPILVAAGAFGILSAAGIVADVSFLPFTAVVLGIVAAISAAVFVFTHWGDIMKFLGGVISGVGAQIGGMLGLAGNLLGVFGDIAGAAAHALGLDTLARTVGNVAGAFYGWWFQVLHLKDALKWAGTELQSFLKWLGILHNPPRPGAHTVAIAATTPKPGSVHATTPGDGTVGMPTYITVPPLKGAKGGGGGMAPAAAVTIHIHAGAVVNHIAPGHGHDPAKIADEVSKKSADALVKGFRDAMAHSGTGPITTLHPTLHRTS